jgi:hypothetical protein
MIGNAHGDDARLKEQMALDDQRCLSVEELVTAPVDDELGNDDGNDMIDAIGLELPQVANQ